MFAGLSAGMSWKPCEDAGKLFVPSKVELTPDPPTIGEKVLFSIKGQADREVASGSLDIAVNYQGMDIFQDSKDLCARTTCPIKQGPLDITYSQELPPIAPPGEYEVQVTARDESGAALMCIVVDFELVPPGASWFRKTKSKAFGRKGGQTVAVV